MPAEVPLRQNARVLEASQIIGRPKGSIAGQLAAWLSAISFLLLAVTATILSWGTVAALNWADDQVGEKRLETVRGYLQAENPDSAMIAHEVSEDNQGPRQIFIRIFVDNPHFVLATPNFPAALRPELFPKVQGTPLDEIIRASMDADGKRYRLATARISFALAASRDAIIQVAIDTSQDQPALDWYRNLLVGVLAGALLLSAMATWCVVRRKLLPISKFADQTSRIRSTTLDRRLDISGLPAELHELGQSFNDMLQRLEVAYQGLRQYSDDIAHELRSPLSRMLLNGEVTLARDRSSEDMKSALAFNVDECRQLVDLVETLLFVARAENKQMALNRQKLDIAHELRDIAAYYEPSASERDITVEVSPGQSLEANLDRMLFRRAVSNVVANAIAHTPPGGCIKVSAATERDRPRISVSDSGKGIDPADLPHVFDRFYRGDKARSFGGGRLGLGLAIVKGIVDLHGGSVAIESTPGAGTRIDLVFAEA